MSYQAGDIVVWNNGATSELLYRKEPDKLGEQLWEVGFTVAKHQNSFYQRGAWREKNFRHAKNSEIERYIQIKKERE